MVFISCSGYGQLLEIGHDQTPDTFTGIDTSELLRARFSEVDKRKTDGEFQAVEKVVTIPKFSHVQGNAVLLGIKVSPFTRNTPSLDPSPDRLLRSQSASSS